VSSSGESWYPQAGAESAVWRSFSPILRETTMFLVFGRKASFAWSTANCLQVPVENDVHSSQTRKVSKWHCGCYEFRKQSRTPDRQRRKNTHEGVEMKEQTVRLGPREQQIVELLLQGCDNAEIASQLKMARRTVKAHFNRLFLRFGITGGIKRVKLATLLYRRQACLQLDAMGTVSQVNVNTESSSSLPKA
jgi:DNA-binding CsgD family transcriptional regulator